MSFKAQSHTSHLFSQIPKAEIQRSSFDRSHGHKTAFDAGYLIPIFVDEALPGDTFNCNATAYARLATPIFPIMDNMVMDMHFFAVPLRLLWSNFRKFMGEQTNPGDSTSFVIPTMTSPGGGYSVGSLHDYMGIPTGVAGIVHSSLFARAYNLIWNEWYRSEDLQNSVVVDLDDGPDTPGDYVLLRRGKRHDYFTSCLPWPQKGTAVQLPLGTSAPIISDTYTSTYIPTAGAVPTAVGSEYRWGGPGTTNALYADLSSATAATINNLRQAWQIQRLLERDARGGTRYAEIVKAHFNVTFPDLTYRPEYLGGGSTQVNISVVPKTSSTDATSPQGNLAAMGTAVGQGGFTKSFTEHSIIIGLASVRADLTYQRGLNKMFKRSTRYDFYWPALANIGEQAVLQGEIFTDGTSNDNIVFGYQERYAEYRYKPSLVTGLMRSVAAGTLDSWHLAQDYAAAPTLNSTFIVEDPPLDRCIAVPTEPHFIFDSYFRLKCARPMPVYGVPGLVDHF